MTKREQALGFTCLVLLGLLGISTYFFTTSAYKSGYYQEKYERARVCNKGFQLYLYYNHGFKINLDSFYEDAVKWVDEPEYQVDGIK